MILDSNSEVLMSKTCGTTIPETISFTNVATLIFHSDYSVTEPGFSATLSEFVVMTQLNNPTSSLEIPEIEEGLCRPETVKALKQGAALALEGV